MESAPSHGFEEPPELETLDPKARNIVAAVKDMSREAIERYTRRREAYLESVVQRHSSTSLNETLTRVHHGERADLRTTLEFSFRAALAPEILEQARAADPIADREAMRFMRENGGKLPLIEALLAHTDRHELRHLMDGFEAVWAAASSPRLRHSSIRSDDIVSCNVMRAIPYVHGIIEKIVEEIDIEAAVNVRTLRQRIAQMAVKPTAANAPAAPRVFTDRAESNVLDPATLTQMLAEAKPDGYAARLHQTSENGVTPPTQQR
jgi:hypothetical protein